MSAPPQLQFSRHGLQLGFGSRNEDEVEALGSQLVGEFLAETIGCAGDDRPGAFLAILAQLSGDEIVSAYFLEIS
jgi:hypothetical protein